MNARIQWIDEAAARVGLGAPRARQRVQWLAGPDGRLGLPPIPWNDCWDPPGGRGKGGFNACADAALTKAQRDCANYNPNRYNSRDDCETQTKNVYVNADCLRYCGATATAYRGGDPCNSATAIMYAQQKLGVTSDGAWGPKSQAALLKSGNTFQGLIGCTGNCPSSVPAGSCTGDCQPGFEIDPSTGLCKGSAPVGQNCPNGKEFVNGKCIDVCAEGLSRNPDTGDCELPACPDGMSRATPDGPCVAPTARRKKKGGAGGILLLSLAALGGIAASIAGRGGFTG